MMDQDFEIDIDGIVSSLDDDADHAESAAARSEAGVVEAEDGQIPSLCDKLLCQVVALRMQMIKMGVVGQIRRIRVPHAATHVWANGPDDVSVYEVSGSQVYRLAQRGRDAWLRSPVSIRSDDYHLDPIPRDGRLSVLDKRSGMCARVLRFYLQSSSDLSLHTFVHQLETMRSMVPGEFEVVNAWLLGMQDGYKKIESWLSCRTARLPRPGKLKKYERARAEYLLEFLHGKNSGVGGSFAPGADPDKAL